MQAKDETFYRVFKFMREELDLKGVELHVYAIIYGFCLETKTKKKPEDLKFTGTMNYLADWCGCTRQAINKALKSLVEQGLLNKLEYEKYGTKRIEYTANRTPIKPDNSAFDENDTSLQSCNLRLHPSQSGLHNNTIDNKIDNNIKTNTKVLVEEKSSESISENKLNNNNLVKTENDLVDSCIGNCKNLSEEKNDCLESIQGAPKSSIHARTHESRTTTAHRRRRLTGEESADIEKPKKLNKYQKCHVILEEYMANEDEKGGELYEVLKAYLSFRLEVKDKTFYANQWKGMLNKLNTLTDDYSTKVKIVQQSIDRGYMGFFEVKDYRTDNTQKSFNITVQSRQYTTDEKEELERLDRERRQKGMKTEF